MWGARLQERSSGGRLAPPLLALRCSGKGGLVTQIAYKALSGLPLPGPADGGMPRSCRCLCPPIVATRALLHTRLTLACKVSFSLAIVYRNPPTSPEVEPVAWRTMRRLSAVSLDTPPAPSAYPVSDSMAVSQPPRLRPRGVARHSHGVGTSPPPLHAVRQRSAPMGPGFFADLEDNRLVPVCRGSEQHACSHREPPAEPYPE